MKSSPRQQRSSREDVENNGSEPTPAAAPVRPSIAERLSSTFRPQLVRSPPARLSSIERDEDAGQGQNPAETMHTRPGVVDSGNVSAESETSGSASEGEGRGRSSGGSPDEESLAKLREAVNAKILLQQRMRTSYGKRPSPVLEEGDDTSKPPLTQVLSSGSGLTTKSTESGKTIRGSMPPTPAGVNMPIRTPSYPFPYVPGTPRAWSSSFHQPFTNLSPTVTGFMGGDTNTPGRASTGLTSGDSTPAATAGMFMPPGTQLQTAEDPRFPSPNLYHLVLQLNAEPGLEAWWATVTNIMHDHFKAERVTLAMPADPTDIENVPWGQKATFSMNGPEEFVLHPQAPEHTPQSAQFARPEFSFREPSNETIADVRPQKLHPERLRPRLESRHSYAGPGRERKEVAAETPSKPNARPQGPQRTVTHATGLPEAVRPLKSAPRRLPSYLSSRHESLNDPEFSSVAGGADAGPYAEVFPILRALDHEYHPLIESGGVNRVLERGRVVAVTRDYASEPGSDQRSSAAVTPNEPLPEHPPPQGRTGPQASKMFGNYRHVFASENLPETRQEYEEYEQHPTSPWAQSPAPSPAIQSDEEHNPFFTSEAQQIEDSFNPTASPKDYTQFSQVEAIGVDRADTVIHLPLVHPTLSQPMQSLRLGQTDSKKGRPPPQRSDTIDSERRAPIAILSVLGTPVPYPPNLIQSMKLLGPHLATSLAIAQQFSGGYGHGVSIRHRRSASGRNVATAPMTIETTTLDDIVNADLEEPPGSMGESVTSPSDWSDRSRHSPGSSFVGTPGWDPSSHGWTQSRSVAGTPAYTGAEVVDNYFDSKKRSGQRATSNASQHSTPARSAKKNSSQDSKDTTDSRSERKLRVSSSSRDEKTPFRPSEKDKSGATENLPSPSRPGLRNALSHIPESPKHHSYLHSYGADFGASFGPLSNTHEPKGQHAGSHGRKPSYSDEMPPPSERLLRTIIDSLPVQIYTAEPDTGKLTWVNSKFLIYRGQDSRQVLSEPWQAIHPEDRNEYMDTWNRSLRTGQQLQLKVRLLRFDGSYRWFYVRAAPLKDKRQNIVHWIGTNMDFHEQHMAEMNLSRQQETAASEAKYRALANSSPQVVFAVNRTKGVTFCNSQWMYYSGQSETQALGVGFMDHVHPDDLAKCRLPTFDQGSAQPTNVPTSLPAEPRRTLSTSAASSSGSSETERGSGFESSPPQAMPQRKLSELARTGILKVSRDADGRPSYSTEVRLRSKDGEFRWHLVRILLAEPLLQSGKDGKEEETWYGTCTDINDHKTLERDLKETMDEKSRFLSNMSHEIRTPLNGITGMVNFLIDSNLTSEQMEHVNIIRASTEGLRGLINDILDLSKAEAGMIQLNMDWMYVRALIEEVNDLTSTMAIDKGLELNYVVDFNVPAQVKGDRFRLRQILLNVIGNAIKFTQEGEVFVSCSIQQDVEGELSQGEMFIKFEVVDTGRGFTDKEAEALFKRFSQIDGSSTRQHGGTGLGLVISRQLAQLHGGDMSARGAPNKGATFAVVVKTTLPTLTDQPPAPPPTPSVIPAIPILPMAPQYLASPLETPGMTPRPTKPQGIPGSLSAQAHLSPKSVPDMSASPSSYSSSDFGRDSPSVSSVGSGQSMPSVARTSSIRSEHSSASSYVPDPSLPTTSAMNLTMPRTGSSRSITQGPADTQKVLTPSKSNESTPTGTAATPPMFSILVVAPLKYSRQATVQHIDKTLPSNVPHQITARENLADCQELLGGSEPVVFSHVIAVLQNVNEIIALMEQVLTTPVHSATTVVIITDLAQRRKIMETAPQHNYKALDDSRRLLFIFKPLKPSRFASIFDPQKGREMSTDRNQDSAQQVAANQKQVFEELTQRLGNRDNTRVLLVEDNKVNQMVILKFFSKIKIAIETAMDGVQCTDKVFANPPGHYSVILCDLHMPNKDGYQTCKDIRRWEKKSKYPNQPIIALSANVLGDVYQKCVEAGFNSYITKPVDFKELSTVLMTFMDPAEPGKPIEFMKKKKGLK